MTQRSFLMLSGSLFTVMAIVHAFRLTDGWRTWATMRAVPGSMKGRIARGVPGRRRPSTYASVICAGSVVRGD
jgi:hypothetical protein